LGGSVGIRSRWQRSLHALTAVLALVGGLSAGFGQGQALGQSAGPPLSGLQAWYRADAGVSRDNAGTPAVAGQPRLHRAPTFRPRPGPAPPPTPAPASATSAPSSRPPSSPPPAPPPS